MKDTAKKLLVIFVGLPLLITTLLCIGKCQSSRQEAADKEAAEQKAAATKATLDDIAQDPSERIAKIRTAIEAEDLATAKKGIAVLEKAKVDVTELKAEASAKGAELAERKRTQAIETALKTFETEKCATDIGAHWRAIKMSNPDDATWDAAKKAAPALEKCRDKAAKMTEKAMLKLKEDARKDVKPKLDEVFLKMGYDVAIRVSGKRSTSIKMTNVLWGNRVILKRLEDGGVITLLENLGFKSAKIGSKRRTWTYDLKPKDELAAIREGIDKSHAKDGIKGDLKLESPDAKP